MKKPGNLFIFFWILMFPSAQNANGVSQLPHINAQSNCAITELPLAEGKNLYPWELLKDKNFKAVYVALLRHEHLNVRWLSSLNGPAIKNKLLSIEGKELVYAQSCKQHECNTHIIHLLFADQEKRIYGLLIENDSTKWLGNPPRCTKEALEMFAHK